MKIRLSKDIQAPIERVFDVFSDITKTAERIEGISDIEILSEVQEGVGTRWRETRIMFGQEAVEEMEISAFNPNQSYEVVAESSGAKYHTIYKFKEQENGTRVNMIFTGKPVTLMARVLTPLAYLMLGTTKKALEADMEALKAVCEAENTP